MDCITVLKPQKMLSKDVSLEQGGSHRRVHKGTCRFCSHTVKSFAVGALVVCLIISLVSTLMLQLKVKELTTRVDLNNEIIYDILHARHVEDQKDRHATEQRFNSHKRHPVERRRHGRSAHCRTVPHFQLKGAGTSANRGYRGIDNTDDVFLWNDNGQILPSRSSNFGAEHAGNGNHVKSVIIQHPGLYYVFAQIHVNGYEYSPASIPRFGLLLMLTRGSTNASIELRRAYVSQDGSGNAYPWPPDSYPQDAISLSGLFPLQTHDRIYIKRPVGDTRIRYTNTPEFSNFGAFLVEETPNHNC